MSKINKLFASLTGSRVDLERKISTTNNPEQTFKEIIWLLPGGIKYTKNPVIGQKMGELINILADTLNVDKNKIFNEDGILDFKEQLAGLSTEDYIKKWDGVSFEEPEFDEETQTYIITEAAHLAWLSKTITKDNTEGKTYRLDKDIDLNEKLWKPIGKEKGAITTDPNPIYFKGVFDGNGHTIRNLYCNVEDEYAKAGLFATLQGTVKNLTIDCALIKSTHYCGAIAAYNRGIPCIIEHCNIKSIEIIDTPENSTGSWDNGDKAGGIIGYVASDGASIKSCNIEKVTISGYRDLGAIAGYVSTPKNGKVTISNNNITKVKINQNLTNAYKDFDKVENHYGLAYGWFDGPEVNASSNLGSIDFELIKE